MQDRLTHYKIWCYISSLFFVAKADEALKAKERSEEEAKKRKEEGNARFFFSNKLKSCKSETIGIYTLRPYDQPVPLVCGLH